MFVVLGPNSVLRPSGDRDSFLIYKIESSTVQNFKKSDGKFQCNKGDLPSNPVERISIK